MHPNQQQGRRMPSLSSLINLVTCSSLVLSCLTKVIQHIHSLRARGVRVSHSSRAFLSLVRAFFMSAVSSCTVPPEIFFVAISYFNRCHNTTHRVDQHSYVVILWILLP